MARWEPSELIRPSELIGRRVFDKGRAELVDINTVPPNTFYDSRFDDDLSVDRLGDGQPNKETVSYLTPLCDDAAVKVKEPFLGWIAVQKKHLKFNEVRPDILTDGKDGVENPFHALIDRSEARQRGQAFHLSRSLLMTFKESGRLVEPSRKVARKFSAD